MFPRRELMLPSSTVPGLRFPPGKVLITTLHFSCLLHCQEILTWIQAPIFPSS